ncbi:hypothetical protein E8E13_009563 [Curvularia kusanoi]|uniref:Uncharacterized protein n=1 Tax=Curvularia kusanoi TaxID=90978 RepID=A0A9P4TH72_CURKU|nr:hypothetical protein E8E13_009563 [Curvularia kusanoi]
MPSIYKTLLLGKDLSNPYIRPYHPAHRAQAGPQTENVQHTTPGDYPTRPKTPDARKTRSYFGPYSAAKNSSKDDTQAKLERGDAGREYASRQVGGRSEGDNERRGRDSEAEGSRKWWARSKLRKEDRENEALNSRSPSPTMLEEARRLAGRDPITGKKRREQAQAQGQGNGQFTSYNARSGQSLVPATQPSANLQKWREEERQRAAREIGGYFAPERPAVREYYGSGA